MMNQRRTLRALFGISLKPMSLHTWKNKPTLTKIIATIGPVSENFDTLQQIVSEGMRVMRINFSHATYEEADLRIKNLRNCTGVNRSGLHHNYNLRAVMLDTQGPEIRTGLLANGAKTISVNEGSTLVLTSNEKYRDIGTSDKLWVSYPRLSNAVSKGSKILLDDGLIECVVTDIFKDSVMTIVLNSGLLKPRRGVNLPGARVTLPALSEKDKADLRWGVKNDVDFVAASFVRKAQDLYDIKEFIKNEHALVWPSEHPMPKIISKVENTEAIDNFDDILALSDGIMVARGDLGVEILMEQVPNMQKWMVRECNRVGKPVIVATQMLESMQSNPRPTRAEVSDVTNAVYDGADSVMLSGESAQGRYPVESVSMMRRIITEAEEWQKTKMTTLSNSYQLTKPLHSAQDNSNAGSPKCYTEGVASAAVHAANVLHAKIILVLTDGGRFPYLVAKHRPNVPVICACLTQKAGRQLMLTRGLHPMVVDSVDYNDEMSDKLAAAQAIDNAVSLGFCQKGDTIVIVTKEKQPGKLSEARSMRVCTVA